jgi:chemotaxis protein MotB
MSRVHRHRVTHDRWLVSYADFITLLFAFFVVLYAFAKADQKKQKQVSASIDTAFRSLGLFPSAGRQPSVGSVRGSLSGSLSGSVSGSVSVAEEAAIPMNIVMGEEVFSPARVKDDLEHLHRELAQTLSNQVATHTVFIHMGRDGLVISLREAGFFASGSAAPKPETLATLKQIAAALRRTPYDLRVEGHTDNIPIHTSDFDSNWELSAARATHIARIFLDMKAMPPDRISAAGYAEFHPVAQNDTAAGRAENRRVDLVVLPRTQVDFSVHGNSVSAGPWRKITDDH